jgi:secreted PhoX family phosphatase
MYNGGSDGWKGSVVAGLDSQLITSANGIYTVDLSLSNTYTITIRDTNDSKTEITGFVVSPDKVTTVLTPAVNYHAINFCSSTLLPDLNCPDDAIRSATTLVQLPIS